MRETYNIHVQQLVAPRPKQLYFVSPRNRYAINHPLIEKTTLFFTKFLRFTPYSLLDFKIIFFNFFGIEYQKILFP
jgi:hypothetical protein